jgi:hypothetical protein
MVTVPLVGVAVAPAREVGHEIVCVRPRSSVSVERNRAV